MTLYVCRACKADHFSTQGDPLYCPFCGEAEVEQIDAENWSYEQA